MPLFEGGVKLFGVTPYYIIGKEDSKDRITEHPEGTEMIIEMTNAAERAMNNIPNQMAGDADNQSDRKIARPTFHPMNRADQQ